MAHRLPNLLIIGVPKAGTTSLFSYLSQHPHVCPSTPKEPNYFTPLRQPGAALAPLASYQQHFFMCNNEPFLMEASPGYAIGGSAIINEIKRLLERPRNVLVLREPTSRLWSAYTFQKARGRLPAASTFDEFVSECQRQRRRGTDTLPGNLYAAFSMGYYADYVEQWLDAFGDDIRIVFSDDLSSDPQLLIEQLCQWLGIDHLVTRSFDYQRRMATLQTGFGSLDRAGYVVKRLARPVLHSPAVRSMMRTAVARLNEIRPNEEMSPESSERIREIYSSSNAELTACLRRHGYARLPHWLQTSLGA